MTNDCYNPPHTQPPLPWQAVARLLRYNACPSAALAFWLATFEYESGGFFPDAEIICHVYQGRSTYINAVGLVQINLPAHPEVTHAQALDPAFAISYAAVLSSNWTDFRPWEAWTAGAAQQLVPKYQRLLGQVVTVPPPVGVNRYTWDTPAPIPKPPRPSVLLPAFAAPIVPELSRVLDDLQALIDKLGFPLSMPSVSLGSDSLYMVQDGDSLSGIAAKVYNSTDAWQRLYAANAAVIGPDPGVIEPGTVLRVPGG
jgi:hypothetical protein